MAFASHAPGSQHLVLHAVAQLNPVSGTAEWTEVQLASLCSELCGKPCNRQIVGVTLRTTLQNKDLVEPRKVSQKHLLWAPTAEARARFL